MALRRPRTERSYPTPITGFDDSGRESYIARSNQGIASLPSSIIPFRTSETPRENFIARTQGGNKDRDFNTSDALYRLFENYKKNPAQEGLLEKFKDKADDFFNKGLEITVPVGDLVKPATSIDPTADDFFLRELYNKFFNPIDPENEGLPMDEFQPYDPNNPNMFMLPDDMDPNDMNIEDIINQMREPRLEATADTYTLPNLLQMLNDARDAGNVDEIELLTNDLEMMYPGATMDVAELSDSQLDFINSQMGTPDFYSNYQDYKDAVDAREEKPLFGIFGGQEPATDSEIINKLKETYGTLPFQVPAIV